MKRLFLIILFLLSLNVAGLSQSNPPLKIRELDGSPSQINTTELIFPNGTLTRSGSRITFSISGGGFVSGSGTNGSLAQFTGTNTLGVATTPIPASQGGTNSRFFQILGPTTLRTYTFPDVNSSIIVGTGVAGRVAFFSDPQTLSTSGFIVWDDTNGRLGVRRSTPTAILHADNIKPADVATATGTAGTEVFRTSGSNTGGDTTISTTGVGGVGSTVTINTGSGGKATAAATSATGGAGGALSLNSAVGGAANIAGTGTNTGGNGGGILVTPGNGGAATGSSSGINLGGTGGQFAVTGGVGGAANTGSGTNTGGPGGVVNIAGGVGGIGSTTGGNGGNVNFSGGASAAAAGSNGGAVGINGANGSSTGTGGAGGGVANTAGNAGGSGNNNGGNVTLTSGTATGSGTPGAVIIAGTGVVQFNGPVTVPAAAADKTKLWTQDAAAGDNNLYSINEAGKNERLTGLATRVSTQFDSTNQTPANITGLTFNLEASKTYSFEASLFTTSDVSGGIQIEISGTATATSIIAEILIRNSGLVTQGRVTSLDSPVGITAVTTALVEIRGTITVNAAGTLTIQAARNAATGTTSVLVGSYFRLIPQGN